MAYVCAAPNYTYNDCNLPDELRQSLKDVLSVDPMEFGIRYKEGIYGAGGYRWPFQQDRFILEDDFTDRLSNFYSAISQKFYPASVLVSICEAIVSRNVIYCTNGTERRVLYETARENDRAAIEMTPDAVLDTPDRRNFADQSWNYFYVGSAGSSNYGHWLIDDLPRIKAAASLILDRKPLRILIPGYGSTIDQVRMDSIRMILRSPVHIDLVNPHVPQHFPNLHYATPVSNHPVSKSPAAIDYAAREMLSALYAGKQVRSDGMASKIYVGRSRGRGRNLANEDCLLPLLKQRGFTFVDTDTITFEQQARIFAQASVVIGTMGAAMANTLFCRPHTRIYYLAPRGWIEPFYLDLAAARGHQYHVLYGDLPDPDVPPHLSDFTISIDALLSAIY